MATSQLPHHISQQFDNELSDLRAKVLSMGGLVEDHLQKALDALSKSEDAPRSCLRPSREVE